ncbi:hypothetical protein GCM10028806_01720 [Spirosoma terrae]|uniref:Uncharacterized protein n=1 Tax=Spirosoma terrae TaxID=1968276 RepID=A0A6L9LG97_9BACT|nr:hypothetical protein [Spirosoma terrae]NDU97568.1 hypothetical protein [Spirosoma terrae]
MDYKSFTIEVETVDECRWDEETATFLVVGQRTVYKIIGIQDRLVYGIRQSMEAAQKTIDKHGTRWRAQ